jgi:cytochrome bd-type quinol oxidase subunit 2
MNYNSAYYNYTLNDSSTNGVYNSYMYCCINTDCGNSIFQFEINNRGDNSSPNIILAIIIILPMILGIIILFGAVNLNQEEHIALKIFLFLLSISTFFASGYLAMSNIVQFYNFVSIQDSLSNNIFIYGLIFVVIIFYFIIYIFYKIIHTIAENKEKKLQY